MATRFIDSKGRLMEIEVIDWTMGAVDWSRDFFEVGDLKYSEEFSAYKVDDIFYLFDRAVDWQWSEGDFSDDEARPEDRTVSMRRLWYVTDGDGWLLQIFDESVDAYNFAYDHLDESPLIFGENGEMVIDW